MTWVALPDGVGRRDDDGSVAVLDVPHRSLHGWLASGEFPPRGRLPVRMRHEQRPTSKAAEGPSWPGAVWGIGMNYASKQRVTGRPLPDLPTFFIKAPSCVRLGGGSVTLPRQAPTAVDYEGEIAVVLGRSLFEAEPEVAQRAVVLVAAANDLTARDVMKKTGNPTVAKSFPGFGQIADTFDEPETLGGLEDIAVSTTVGSVVQQKDTSAGMLLGISQVVSLLSFFVVLRAGDVVLTGTPAGTGEESGKYLAIGDAVSVTVARLPALETRVVATDGTPS